jgi:hypothetical protein
LCGALEVLFDLIEYLFRISDSLYRVDTYYNRLALSGRVQIDLAVTVISHGTVSVLNGNKLLAANPVSIFLGVKARFLAGLYIEVKCSLLILLTPSRSSRSTCSR